MNVLLIEDDAETADYIVAGLTEHGHRVDRVADGINGLSLARSDKYEVAIVDRMVPALDGLSLVKLLREAGTGLPSSFSPISAASTTVSKDSTLAVMIISSSPSRFPNCWRA